MSKESELVFLFTDKTGKPVKTDNEKKMYYVNRPTANLVHQVCKVMCQRSDLTDDELAYYAEMGNLEPVKVEKDTFRKFWEFKNRPYGKATYLGALLPLVFTNTENGKEAPLLVDKKGKVTDKNTFGSLNYMNARKGLDFFFNSFGETLHDVAMYSELQKTTPALESLLTMIKQYKGGDDKHGQELES